MQNENHLDTSLSPHEKTMQETRKWDMIFNVLLAALAVTCLLIRVICHPVVVSGDSMFPTYKDGEILVTDANVAEEKIGYDTIIVFDSGQKRHRRLIKRVVGLPGDTIQIDSRGFIRNGEPVTDGFPMMDTYGCALDGIVLGDGEYFVLGDNRNASTDSRALGPVPIQKIQYIVKGKAFSK